MQDTIAYEQANRRPFIIRYFFINIKKRISAGKMKMLANMEFLKPCSKTNGAIFLRAVNDCRELL